MDTPQVTPSESGLTETEVRARLRSGAIRRGVRVFVALAVITALVLIALTVNRETLEGLRRIKWYWLALTALLWFVATAADGARLAVLSRAGEHRIGPLRAAEVILVGYFMAAVTPFQFGGLPLQLYSMNRWGISPGKASAMLLARGILFYGMVFLAAPFIAYRLGVSSVLVKILSTYIGIIVGAGAALIIFGFAFPRVLARLAEAAAEPEHAGRGWKFLGRMLGESTHFLDGLKLFFRGRNLVYLAGAAGLTVVFCLAHFGMSVAILAGLNVLRLENAYRVVGTNVLLTSVLLFVPTPGAGGVAEAGAAGLFAMLCPKYMLGIFVVIWRLFSFYAGAITGGIVALRHLAR